MLGLCADPNDMELRLKLLLWLELVLSPYFVVLTDELRLVHPCRMAGTLGLGVVAYYLTRSFLLSDLLNKLEKKPFFYWGWFLWFVILSLTASDHSLRSFVELEFLRLIDYLAFCICCWIWLVFDFYKAWSLSWIACKISIFLRSSTSRLELFSIIWICYRIILNCQRSIFKCFFFWSSKYFYFCSKVRNFNNTSK